MTKSSLVYCGLLAIIFQCMLWIGKLAFWEAYVVCLCEFYGITLDYLTLEHTNYYVKRNDELQLWNKIAITCLVAMIVWGLATFIFIISFLRRHSALWQSFVVAVPFTALLALYFNRVYFEISLLELSPGQFSFRV